MIFEWDSDKNKANIANHGLSFEKAQEVFEDPLHLSILDERFSHFEERWITIGSTGNGEIIIAAYLYFFEEQEEKMRIISARAATPKERKQYETIE